MEPVIRTEQLTGLSDGVRAVENLDLAAPARFQVPGPNRAAR
jgi:hypothetical protein